MSLPLNSKQFDRQWITGIIAPGSANPGTISAYAAVGTQRLLGKPGVFVTTSKGLEPWYPSTKCLGRQSKEKQESEPCRFEACSWHQLLRVNKVMLRWMFITRWWPAKATLYTVCMWARKVGYAEVPRHRAEARTGQCNALRLHCQRAPPTCNTAPK